MEVIETSMHGYQDRGQVATVSLGPHCHVLILRHSPSLLSLKGLLPLPFLNYHRH